MSSLREIDVRFIDDLVDFIRGRGYVLDFTDRTFSHFFGGELGIDINDPKYADSGPSKGKKLRRFLQIEDDATVLKALEALWDYRADCLDRIGGKDPVANAEGRFLTLTNKLRGRKTPEATKPAKEEVDEASTSYLKSEVLRLTSLGAQERGYAFEKFLVRLFEDFGMKPREPFRNRGEQIDGSFQLAGETYLLEAKWQNAQTGATDLHAFEGKLSQKAAWARGLFISHSGFTEDGLVAFGRGKRTICRQGWISTRC